MWDIYLEVTIDKKWYTQNFDFLSLKSSLPGQFWGISINFETSCWGLAAKLCVVLLGFFILNEVMF